jgi:REP element-mobilizing transposase RayT
MESVDPRKTPFVQPFTRGELPHLQKPGGFYFVTTRVADAVVVRPKPARSTIISSSDPLELANDWDPPIASGSCPFNRETVAAMMQDTLLHFEGQRYSLLAWCVMPNHLHVIVAPLPPYSLSQIMHSWKSFSSKRANKILGTAGSFWERESFDHLIRSEESLKSFVRYTEENPVHAGLCIRPGDWQFSSAGQRFESSAWTRRRQLGASDGRAGWKPAPQIDTPDSSGLRTGIDCVLGKSPP